MAYYRICPRCGSRLDPGERCDCEEETKEEKWGHRNFANMLIEEGNGQLRLKFERKIKV